MTPYQRGYRDALLSLAKQFEVLIQEEEATIADIRSRKADMMFYKRAAHTLVEYQAKHRLQTAQKCHCLALAAALPDDPEAP